MTKTLGKYFPAFILVSLLLPLLAMGYLGQYSRYIADDYCWAAMVRTQGLGGAFTIWYTTWEGRFTHMVIKGVIGLVGGTVTPFYPALILSSWLLIAEWTLYQLTQAVRLPRPKIGAAILAALILFATFVGTPSRIQSLYWTTGSVPYVGGLILFTFLAGFILYSLRLHPNRVPVWAGGVVALVTFIAGGLSEVYVAFQTAALGLAFLGVWLFAPSHYKHSALILLSIGIMSSLAALFIMANAPGNAVRRASFPSLSLVVVIWRTFYTALAFPFIAAGRFSAIPFIAAVLLPLLYCYCLDPIPVQLRFSPRRIQRLLLLSALAAFILIAACIAPAMQSLGTPPAARAYVIPQFILVGTAIFWGAVMGLSARRAQPRLSPVARSVTAVVTAIVLLAGPLATAGQILADVPDFRTYASEWDSRDAAIRMAVQRGEQHIGTTMLTTDIGVRAGLEPIGPEAETGVNICAADYYGVERLTARTPIQIGDKSR